jgi:DNA-binding CsgD family transcriptional regulator
MHWSAIGRGFVALGRNELAMSVRHYEHALEFAPLIRNPDNHEATTRARLGFLAIALGDLHSADRHFERAGNLARVCGNPILKAWVPLGLGQCRREQGDLATAVGLFAESHQAGRLVLDDSGMAAALVSLSIVALRLGKHDIARQLLAISAPIPRLFEDEAEYARATSLLLGASDVPSPGRPDAASLAPDSPEVDLIFDLLLAECNSAARRARSPGLSPRETDVLRLLAAGGSNRDIADTLSISVRTVENHVLHILTKLDLHSRTEAAAWAVRNGLIA